MDSYNGIFYRFMVLDHEKFNQNKDLRKGNLAAKHVYFLKDTFIKEDRLLCILAEEFENKTKSFRVSKKYYSNDFDEVKYVFEQYIKK